MPQRSLVESLPVELKSVLDQKLINSGFSGYVDLSDWLKTKGYEISKSSLHRYGEKLEERSAAIKASTEAAKAIANSVKDDEGAMGQALVALTQEHLFSLLMEVEQLEISPKSLASLTNAISRLSKASISQKKYADEVRKQALEEAASAVGEEARAQGMDEEQVKFWTEKVLGMQ